MTSRRPKKVGRLRRQRQRHSRQRQRRSRHDSRCTRHVQTLVPVRRPETGRASGKTAEGRTGTRPANRCRACPVPIPVEVACR